MNTTKFVSELSSATEFLNIQERMRKIKRPEKTYESVKKFRSVMSREIDQKFYNFYDRVRASTLFSLSLITDRIGAHTSRKVVYGRNVFTMLGQWKGFAYEKQ